MITVFNPNKLTGQPFFGELINYLHLHEPVTLRQIKREFPQVKHLERSIEDYVQAGYILRRHKRYYLTIPLLDTAEEVSLDEPVFANTESSAYQDLLALRFKTYLTNATNQVVLVEVTDFARDRLTLANYFHKLKEAQPISREQEKLYTILGDVNPDYALKYMTTFLLKFTRKEIVKQRRPDIFVQALEVLGYLRTVDDQTYCLTMDFDQEQLLFKSRG